MSHSEENGPLRRHTGFWQAFKTWYRIQITVGGDRPAHWEALLHANGLRSAEEEALLHANGLRSAEEVNKYNRSYKSKKTMLQTAAFVKSKQIQQSSTSEHTMDRASITSGVVGDIEGLVFLLVPPTSLLLSPFTNSHKVSFRMIPCMPAQPVASTSWYPPLRVGPPLRVVSIIESGASQTDEPCTSWKRSFSDQLSNAQNKRSRRESTTSVFGPESLSSVVKGPNQRTSYVITTSLSSVHAASVPSSSFSLDDYVL
eukprot:gene10849-16967_t